jgi:protein-tyrosine kinase
MREAYMTEDTEVAITQKLARATAKPASKVPALETGTPRTGKVVSVTATRSVLETVAPQIPQPPDILYRPLSQQAHRHARDAQMVQEQCRRLCLSVFFRERVPARSLGFTSSLGGEGKTLLAMVTASVLVRDSHRPVTLLECNWEHPCLHEHFGFAPTPGLAEWLRGESDKASILHRIHPNLTVIPAGDGRQDATSLLRQIRQQGLSDLLALSSEFLVVDLPAIIPVSYGPLAASIVESLAVVVHAGVTSDVLVAETCMQIKNLPVQGLVLNQMESRIPRWLRNML